MVARVTLAYQSFRDTFLSSLEMRFVDWDFVALILMADCQLRKQH
jgi:hypothetical protein